jgi:glutamate/tyrosine decarboxylase-like PLP-dependent enzyme
VIDPIEEIAATARGKGIRCHVDACIGGWVPPHADVAPFDFAVPGVTSISVDLHKYACCPKGTSVLLHANTDLRRTQYFASAAWPGYTMLNSTAQSTRSGGPLAAAWTVLRHIGDDGYREPAKRTPKAVRTIRAGIEQIDGLRVLGDPDATLLAVTADRDDFDVFTVADEMKARNWYVQPQFTHGPSPANLHLTITAANAGGEAELLADLEDSVQAAIKQGPVPIAPEVVAAIRALDPDSLTPQEFAGLPAAAGLHGDSVLPARMAPVNALLAAASPRLRERLLVEFLGVLYS